MARIIVKQDGAVISPETAMKWYCWYEIVEPMREQDKETLDAVIRTVDRNIPDWEMQVLKKYLELSNHDLIVGGFIACKF